MKRSRVTRNAVLEQFVPRRLKDTFLTDGDRVQRFIAGSVAAKERQHNVHQAIRALLGLDRLETAEEDISAVERQFRKEMAATAGDDARLAQENLENCEVELVAIRKNREDEEAKRAKIDEEIADVEKQLSDIRGTWRSRQHQPDD